MLLATKDLIKIFGACDMNTSVFSLWSEMEVGCKWWKCDLRFTTCLHLNWFFWERNERCCTANDYTEQLTPIIAGWWHWLHQAEGKIRSLSWVLSCQGSLACETGQGLEDSHWSIFKGYKCFQAVIEIFGPWDWSQSFSQSISKVKTVIGLSFVRLCEWIILLSTLFNCLLMVYSLLCYNPWFRNCLVEKKRLLSRHVNIKKLFKCLRTSWLSL